MIFACIMDYGEPTAMAPIRPAHRDYLFGLIAQKKVVAAGNFPKDLDGGLFLYEAASLEEAQQLVDGDPFVVHGLIRNYKLREYEIHGANPELLRVAG